SPSVNATYPSAPIPLPNGGFATMRSADVTFAPGGYVGLRSSTFWTYLRRYDATGTMQDETAVASMTTLCSVSGQGHPCYSLWRGGSLDLLGFGDGTLGVLWNYANGN